MIVGFSATVPKYTGGRGGKEYSWSMKVPSLDVAFDELLKRHPDVNHLRLEEWDSGNPDCTAILDAVEVHNA